ncbi:SDR family NAD(P)-dependent oxidoreductase [Parendozoicomonas haliclonae]|nr:SDR family NAD(P)-dependent oxidoreductase [Parendozoicomonas haliclonae]
MSKNILITGSTDGIGLETAKMLAALGHNILLHGRSTSKLEQARSVVESISSAGRIECVKADLSLMSEVHTLANQVKSTFEHLDVLINNAGVFRTLESRTSEGLEIHFAVNTFAPYLLTRLLLDRLDHSSRVINLSSAAQSPVNMGAFTGAVDLGDSLAYAQSKLALTMWNNALARELGDRGPVLVAVNPASFLGSKMVKEAYGMEGHDLSIGAKILVKAALSDEFAQASGRYFDNDNGRFADPHPEALNQGHCEGLVKEMNRMLENLPQP